MYTTYKTSAPPTSCSVWLLFYRSSLEQQVFIFVHSVVPFCSFTYLCAGMFGPTDAVKSKALKTAHKL